ncbi:hypothetical protein [Actinobacillus equuli]|uniref:hypothetical protein n=1 Tax=Actinobacillus equuli TaxID=718 RepID=UPI002441A31B|nr:hypothetical protein [Actinobacillus equuli]WGE74533.1 hypothetical protein NYR81_05825 [Actinobacillus equuli subsp. haemolyticus]WGE77702.1 hypothetical protein NYR82_02170 [Actinobacillus equuli subsp. haemolyticus]
MFYLKKHYYDGIDKQGNAFIIYFAELMLWGIKIPYSSILFNSKNGQQFEKSSLFRLKQIDRSITHSRLNFSAYWIPHLSEVKSTLVYNQTQYVNWHCHTPKGHFHVSFQDKEYQGLGYAEMLEMNFAPWELAVSELYWGRFLSENHTIIWKEWRGKQSFKQLIWNGKQYSDFEIQEEGILLPSENMFLRFQMSTMLKNEPIGNVIAKIPLLKYFLPKRFLRTRIIKWKSETKLLINQNVQEVGYALYQKVLWRK